ncbi:MAG: helix-turn-helix transcriptional regulator [Lachnospiraceae bacterium]|nr:helix-turn-helix transcriptional regulator [Lachnospiraceae bacterium]
MKGQLGMKKPGRKRTDINVEIGNRLKRLRKENQLSVDEMAEAFGIVRDSYTRIENGTTGLSGEYAYILATKYKFDMNYLIGGFVNEDISLHIENQIRENDDKRLSMLLHEIADILESRNGGK